MMRQLSHHMALSSMQLRELMGAFLEDFMRAELFVLFILRVTDIHNEKVFRVRFAANPTLMKQLRNRLGEATCEVHLSPCSRPPLRPQSSLGTQARSIPGALHMSRRLLMPDGSAQRLGEGFRAPWGPAATPTQCTVRGSRARALPGRVQMSLCVRVSALRVQVAVGL